MNTVGARPAATRGRAPFLDVARLLLLFASIVALALGCNESSPSSTPVRLVWPNPNDNEGHETVPPAAKGKPFSFGGMYLCISAAGSARIKKVVTHGGSGGVRIADFAVRPHRALQGKDGLGAAATTLDEMEFDTDVPVIVKTTCPKSFQYGTGAERHLMEFAVQVERASSKTASYDGLTLVYSAEGSDDRKLEVKYGITLCAPGDSATEYCTQPS